MAEQQQLRFFYKGRMTKPKEYTYSEEGDAIRLNKDGGGIRATVTLPTYRAPTETELLAQEATRRAAIGVAESKFDEARIHLLTLTANEDSLPSQLKQGMLAVALADQELQQVRYPLKYVNVYPSIPTNRLMFDSPRDERVLADVRVFKSRPFSLQETYVRTSKIPGASEEVEVQGVPAEGGPPEEASGPVIVFSLPSEEDPYGFLSSWWPVYMTFKGTVYRNAYQAIQAEIAEYFGRQDLAVTIRDTEQPEDIALRVDMLPEATQDTWDAKMRELVLAVTREKFDAHPELAEKLVQTGDAVLGAVPPEDPSNTLLGIGMGTDHPSAKNPSKWTGQNVYGKALEEARDAIMTRRKGMVAQAPVLLEPPPPPPAPAPPARLPRRLRNTAATAVQSIAEVAGQAQQGIVYTVSSIATAVTEALSPSSDTSPGTIASSTSSGTTTGTSLGTANSSGTTTSSDTKRTVSISSNITRALDPLKNL